MKTPSLTHKKLLSSSAALLSARIFGIGVTFLTLALLSKRLTPDEFGAWNILLSAFQLSLLAELGLGTALRNRVSSLVARGRGTQASLKIVSLMWLFLTILVPLAALAGASGLLPGLLGLPPTPAYRWMVALVVLSAVLSLVCSTAFNCFYCHAEGGAVALVEWGRNLFQLAAIALCVWFGGSLVGYVLSFYGALLLVSVAGAAAYFQRRRFNPFVLLARGRKGARTVLRTGRELIGEALQQGFVHAGAIVNLNIGAIVVASELSLADAGVYSVMMRLFGAALTMHVSVITPYWTAFTVKFQGGEREWMARTVRVLSLATIGVWAVGLVAVVFAGPWITEVLVHQRIERGALWLLFAAWALLGALSNLHTAVLQSVSRIGRLAVVVGISVALHFVLATVLGRALGVYGVICATLVASGTILAFSAVEAWSLMGARKPLEATD